MAEWEARFGVQHGDLYSRHWVVRSARGREGVEVMTSAVHGPSFHVSIHEESYGFHILVDDGVVHKEPRPYPARDYNGAKRFVEVRMPGACASRPEPRRSHRILWVPVSPDPERWTTFHLILTEPGLAEANWLAQNDRQRTLTTLPRYGGGEVVIVQSTMTGYDGKISGASVSPNAAELKKLAQEGRAGAILQGQGPDRAIWLLDLPSRGSVNGMR